MEAKGIVPLFVLCTFTLASCVVLPRVVSAVHSGIIRVPQDYPTIQEAVNAANSGDTIQVSAGTYNEYVYVNKSLNIIGESATNTTVWSTDVFEVYADNVNISGFKINSGVPGSGVALIDSHGCGISHNLMLGGLAAIFLYNSRDNIIACNQVRYPMGNGWGILLLSSNYNTVRENSIASSAQQSIAISVTGSANNKLEHNQIEDCYYGILISDGNDNKINGNIVENNREGITLWRGRRNSIYHNNLFNNLYDVEDTGENVWNNGAEGNYWSDYNGTDLNGDGIGDTYLPWQGVDHYPLIDPWGPLKTFHADVNETTHTITILSESTIASFDFNPTPLRQISFNSTGPPGGVGFCNITIPKALLDGHLLVLVADRLTDFSLSENETHSCLYFTYTYSTRKIRIAEYTPIPGDINYDGRVDLYDIVVVATAYGTRPDDPNWNPDADIAPPWGKIDLYDAVTILYHYGKTYQN